MYEKIWNQNKIAFGGDYNPEQWDEATWEEDMHLFGLAHIDTVTLNVFSWAMLQPDEITYDFTKLDRIMELVKKNGLKVVLATSTGAHPAWMAHRYPEILRTEFNGMKRKFGGRHNSCPNSPVYRMYSARLAEKLAEHYKDYDNIVAWHISNEYGGECYCENCEKAFHVWLKKKYHTIEEVNRVWDTAFWGHTFYDWEEIVLPNLLSEHFAYERTMFQGISLDYRRFNSDSILECYRLEYEAVKRHTPDIPVTLVEALSDGEVGTIIVEKTPFYATMGGQQGDKGEIRTASGIFQVEETIKLRGGKVGHIGKMTNGMIKAGDVADLSVDAKLRRDTCRNHSATHLLQKALREVLGTHVEQAGSYQDGERTRFDFSHFAAMTPEELKKVEAIVNEKIAEKIDVRTDVMTVEEAKKTGAMALFGEKYGETVRVVSMGDFSKEFCGGTHVANTGDIVVFKIISESGVAAGVRRIEALTGDNVFAYYKKEEEELEAAAKAAKATPATLVEKIGHLMAELKALQSENESLKSKAAKEALGDVMDQVVEVKGVKLLAVSVDGVDMNGLRDLGDQLKGKLGEGVIVLASASDGKVNLVAMATDDAMAHGAHAGNLIKSIAGKVGGGGGGRPNMAQAGGKNPAGIPDAIAEAKTALEAQLA